jgi:hypothetical protein
MEGGRLTNGMDGVRVPVDLLLDSTLTASAKVIWMALRLYPELTKDGRPSPTRLAALTGLSRPTVRKGITSLAEAGWCGFSPKQHDSPDQVRGQSQGAPTSTPQRQGWFRTYDSPRVRPQDSLHTNGPNSPSGVPVGQDVSPRAGAQHSQRASYEIRTQACAQMSARDNSQARPQVNSDRPDHQRFVTIPWELLEDRCVRPQAVVMYGVLQMTPGFEHPDGKYTCKQLRELTGRALKTIRRATDLLAGRGWLVVNRKNHLCPFAFTIRNPIFEECMAELERVKRRIERAEFKGEALMKGFCTLAVPLSDYVDNPRLGSIVNPFTGETLELDRLYYGRLALEFNGPQHYQETEFASAEEVLKQRVRDLIKAMICQDQGIPLVVIHPEDLTLKTMIEKLSPYVPIRDLRSKGPIIQYLEEMAERYRRAIRRRKRSTAN